MPDLMPHVRPPGSTVDYMLEKAEDAWSGEGDKTILAAVMDLALQVLNELLEPSQRDRIPER